MKKNIRFFNQLALSQAVVFQNQENFLENNPIFKAFMLKQHRIQLKELTTEQSQLKRTMKDKIRQGKAPQSALQRQIAHLRQRINREQEFIQDLRMSLKKIPRGTRSHKLNLAHVNYALELVKQDLFVVSNQQTVTKRRLSDYRNFSDKHDFASSQSFKARNKNEIISLTMFKDELKVMHKYYSDQIYFKSAA